LASFDKGVDVGVPGNFELRMVRGRSMKPRDVMSGLKYLGIVSL
jgi:hypothetical protein